MAIIMRVSNKKRLYLALMMTLAGIGAYAQADVNSPYSVFGIGQMADKSMNVRLIGMGGVTNAMYDGSLINTGNPASYAKIDSLAFLFDAGFYLKTSNFSTSNLTEQAANASFNQLMMAFGITPWWKMALGVQPYSVLGYKMVVDSYDSSVGNYTTAFQGSGGLNQVVIGNAFKLGKHFSVGANVNYVFGDSETLTTLYFPDSAYMISSRRGVDMMVSSFRFDYGLLYTTGLGKDYSLSVGLTYDQRIGLNGKQTNFFRTIAGDINTSSEYLIDTILNMTSNMKLTLPQGVGFGMVLRKNNRWILGVDVDWTQWSEFSKDGVTDGLNDAWRAALGFEYNPEHTSVSGYFRRATYRVGGFYEHTYMEIKGHPINKAGFVVGASLPLPKSLSKVNMALEVGRCGTKQDGLIQESYIKFDVGISMFERWFMKHQYR